MPAACDSATVRPVVCGDGDIDAPNMRRCEPEVCRDRLRRVRERAVAAAPPIAPLHPIYQQHEAIDPNSHFVWFEDDLESEDAAWLRKHRRVDAFVRVDATNRWNPLLMLGEVKARLEGIG
jgi:hypothetical protein